MRRALWPIAPPGDIDREIDEHSTSGTIYGSPTNVLIADRGGGRLGGFVEASLRPLADGCRTSPVGYIEGWYVDDDARRQGIGRSLMRAAEEWARGQGCREMASDCLGHNHVSFAAHRKLGYTTPEREITFRKSLGGADPPGNAPDWIALSKYELSSAAAVRHVTDGQAGGIAVFLGTTRAEENAAKQPLVALDYDA